MHRAFFRRTRSQYDLQNDLANIRDALADATYDAKGRLGEIISQSVSDVKDRSMDAKESVENYVAEKPFQSIGIAILAGFLLGFLFRR